MPAFQLQGSLMEFCPDQKFVCSEGVLLQCNFVEGSYVPEKVVSKQKVLNWVQFQLNNPEESKPNQTGPKLVKKSASVEFDSSWSPYTQQKRRKCSEHFGELSLSPRKQSTSSASGILLKNIDDKDALPDDVFSDENIMRNPKEDHKRNERIRDQLLWLTETKGDLVTMETTYSLRDVKGFLDVIEQQKSVVAFQIKTYRDLSITISYQILHDFREDFMMLSLNSGHFLFLEPF